MEYGKQIITKPKTITRNGSNYTGIGIIFLMKASYTIGKEHAFEEIAKRKKEMSE